MPVSSPVGQDAILRRVANPPYDKFRFRCHGALSLRRRHDESNGGVRPAPPAALRRLDHPPLPSRGSVSRFSAGGFATGSWRCSSVERLASEAPCCAAPAPSTV